MAFFRTVRLSDRKESPRPDATFVALGNFDGVHLGHQSLLRKTVDAARQANASPAVFCFDPPSSDFLLRSEQPRHLCTLSQKLQRFSDAGIEYVYLADFQSLRNFSIRDFIEEVLKKECNAVGTVCGFNFRFGKNGSGTSEDLCKAFENAITLPPYTVDGEIVSSTQIRTFLAKGEIERANRFLGERYSFFAEVEHGKRLGRTIGFPTINQQFPIGLTLPGNGVYKTLCRFDGTEREGLSNVGSHPTVDESASVNCETFLRDFDGDLYGKTVETVFLSYLRKEIKFQSVEELKLQIQKDLEG